DAAAELMHIGQAILVRLVNKDRIGVRNIEAAFDNRCRYEHVAIAPNETEHDLLKFIAGHLAMADADARLGHDLLDLLGNRVDVLHAIVDKEDLAVAVKFPKNRVADERGIEAGDPRLNRQPIARRRLQVADVANTE